MATMIRPKGLGRGLDALLAGADKAESSDALQAIAIERLQPGKYQPRTQMDDAALEELAASIREHGVMQPILVRPIDGGGFEIVAGERRWRAAKRAGLAEVPALVKAVPDQSALALALIENIQREDLNPLEQANGLHRLVEEFGLTHDAVAKAVGRSRSAVTNLLRLRELAKPVQAQLLHGQIDMGHARALLALAPAQQTAAAARVIAQGLSVRETERLVHQFAHPGRRAGRRAIVAPDPDPDLARLQEELADALGATVTIVPKANGSGKLVIGYSTLEQLDGILAKLR
jgi:ParB family transcriptional regulator, chromosome partitioning protein